MAALLYWRSIAPNLSSTTLFPVWWDRERVDNGDTATATLLLPVYWSKSNREENTKVFFPFVWSLSNPSYKSTTILPFYSTGTTPDRNNTHTMAALLYWHLRDSTSIDKFLLPLFWDHKNWYGGDTLHSILIPPLYYSLSFKKTQNHIVFPLLWVLQSEQYHSWTIPPLYSYGKSSDGRLKHLTISPLFWRFVAPDRSSSTLFPVWWGNKYIDNGDTTTTKLVLPLYWSKTNKEVNDKVVFPLVWSLSNPSYKSTTILPLYSTGASPDGKYRHTMAALLYWRLIAPDRSSSTLFPVWWGTTSVDNGDTTTTNLVLPLYWSKTNEEVNDKVVFPLVWSLSSPSYKSTTILPLYSTGASPDGKYRHTMAALLYWRLIAPDRSSSTLFPVWWGTTSVDNGDTTTTKLVLPLYWSKTNKEVNDKVVFPLVWSLSSPSYKSTTILPLYSTGASPDGNYRHTMAALLYWRLIAPDRLSSTLFPVWWGKKYVDNGDTVTTNIVVPLYWSKRTIEENTNVFFPLVWSLSNPLYKSITVFPFYSAGTTPDSTNKHLIVTPLYWDLYGKDQHHRVLFPFFGYSSKRKIETTCNILFFLYKYDRFYSLNSHSFLWPIINITTDDNFCSWRFAPLLWYKKSPKVSYFTFQPFFYIRQDSLSHHFNLLWNIYSQTSTFGFRDSKSVLFNAFFWNRYHNNDHEIRLFYQLFADVHKDGVVEKSIFPFYHSVRKPDGEKKISVMFSFYKYIKQKKPGTTKFYQEDKLFWFIRLRSNYRSIQEDTLQLLEK